MHLDELEHMLTAYFHQDWDYEYDTWEQAVDDFVRRSPDRARSVPAQVHALLHGFPDPDALHVKLLELGSTHDPTALGTTHRDWLIEIRQRILDVHPDMGGRPR